MSPTEYDADIFFENKSYFSGVMDPGIKICFIGPQLSHLLDTTPASLEHN